MSADAYTARYNSAKFRWLSFVAALMVVAIYATSERGVEIVPHGASCFFWIWSCLIWSPVAFFFVVSGYWFGKSDYVASDGSWRSLWIFWTRKIKSLLLPYLVFALFGVVFTLPVFVFCNYTKGGPLLARTLFDQGGLWGILNHGFGIVRPGPIHNGSLWYVRALLILFALAPLWRWIVRQFNRWVVLLSFFMLVCVWHNTVQSVPFVNLSMISVYFIFGLFCSVSDDLLLPRRSPVVIVLALFFIYSPWFSYLRPIAACAALWTIYDIIMLRANGMKVSTTPVWIGLSFWVYVTHAVVSNWMVPLGHYVLGETSSALIVNTILTFAVFVVFCMWSGLFMKKHFPRMLAVLCGGR